MARSWSMFRYRKRGRDGSAWTTGFHAPSCRRFTPICAIDQSPQPDPIKPRVVSRRMVCERPETPSLRLALVRWKRIVGVATPMIVAISVSVFPAAAHLRHWISRRVSCAQPAGAPGYRVSRLAEMKRRARMCIASALAPKIAGTSRLSSPLAQISAPMAPSGEWIGAAMAPAIPWEA